MNKDAKIGLIAILALVVLLVIFWGRSTFWNRDEEVVSEAPTPPQTGIGDSTGEVASVDTSQRVEPQPTAVADQGNLTTGGARLTGPVTTLPDGSLVPPQAPVQRSPAPSVAIGIAPAPTVAAGTTYVVQKGDSLSSIAKKFYGDESQWRRIAAANHLSNPNALQIGTKLAIPSHDGAPPAAPAAPTAPPVAVVTDGSTTYVVQKGDTLASIAQKVYKDASKWQLIAEANRADPKRLQVGQKLVIPSLSGSSSQAATTGAPAAAPAR